MVARAFSETSGKICSRTSPRAEEDAVVLGAFAEGKVSVRTAARAGVATGELSGCGTGFFSAAAVSEVCVAVDADGLGADGVSRRAGCSIGSGCAAGGAEAVGADEGGSGRWPRIFGRAKIATITRNAAATGTT